MQFPLLLLCYDLLHFHAEATGDVYKKKSFQISFFTPQSFVPQIIPSLSIKACNTKNFRFLNQQYTTARRWYSGLSYFQGPCLFFSAMFFKFLTPSLISNVLQRYQISINFSSFCNPKFYLLVVP